MSTPKKKETVNVTNEKHIITQNTNNDVTIIENIEKCVMCGNEKNISNKYNIPICENCIAKFSEELKYIINPKDVSGIKKLVEGAELILKGLHDLYGINPDDDNFKDTPRRVARLMMEMNYGTNIQASKDLLNVSFPTDNNYSGLVSSNNIHVSSLCPHHLIVVNYTVNMAYIPSNGRYVGLSKLPRLAKTLAKSMLLQEEYTKKLIDIMDSELKAQGCAVMVSGIHNCIQSRGAEMHDIKNVTVELSGVFARNPELKKEWLSTIQLSKGC